MSCPTGNTQLACLENGSSGIAWHLDRERHFFSMSDHTWMHNRKRLLARQIVSIRKEGVRVAGMRFTEFTLRYQLSAVLAKDEKTTTSPYHAIQIIPEAEKWHHSGVDEISGQWEELSYAQAERLPKAVKAEMSNLRILAAARYACANRAHASNAQKQPIPPAYQPLASALQRYETLSSLREGLADLFTDVQNSDDDYLSPEERYASAMKRALGRMGIAGIELKGIRKGDPKKMVIDGDYLRYLEVAEPALHDTLMRILKRVGRTPDSEWFDGKAIADEMIAALPKDFMRLAFDADGQSLLANGGYLCDRELRRALQRGETVSPEAMLRFPDLIAEFGMG